MEEIIDLNQIPEQLVNAWQARITLVESLLDDTISYQEKKKLRLEYMAEHNVCARTIRYYVAWYKKEGAARLLLYRPRPPAQRIEDQALQAKILDLIDERPTRSVKQLRDLLSCLADFKEKINRISNRTIYRFLQEKGLTKKKRYIMACASSRTSYHQFEASQSLALVQGDARDGIWIVLPDGKKRKTYLFVWLDDHSRKILYAEYYWDEKLPRMEDSFMKMILRWGLAEKVYLDNGHVYSAKHFAWLLAQLKIKKIHHKPYAAYCKGKIESCNKTLLYEFQAEAQLAGMSSLDELNTALWAWIDMVYNLRKHSSTGEVPNKRFQDGLPREVRRVTDIQWFNNLFLMRDTRTVSKYGKVKLFGNQYRVKDISHGTVVEVRFNPFDLKEVYIFTDKKYNQTVTPAKLNTLTAPSVPEESKKSQHTVSQESRNYFTTLREQHQKMLGQKQIPFYELKQEETDEEENKKL
ncbi:MAG TPA: Mu transposase C-terminal domain-containing protein [Bacteroidales bacterium]|nr:Mu transposase C-terminal domain-containing protein [Bacteroidales bacterium]